MTEPAAPVEQALFILENDQLHERGASDGLAALANWRAEAERLCRAFGALPPEQPCPLALFAQPFAPQAAAVVQVGELPSRRLGFRLLILERDIYVRWCRDPFALGECFPPDWQASGLLPTLQWPLNPPPRRTAAQLQKVLETGGSPTLLGAAQALVDGGRVVFERPLPAPQLIRDLWQLLPDSVQGELWPATFAFGNDLRFDLLVVPGSLGLKLDRYVTEEQALDYPHGRYEFSLQYAIENGDQRELDRLLGRLSGKQALRRAIWLLVISVVAYLGINFLLRFL